MNSSDEVKGVIRDLEEYGKEQAFNNEESQGHELKSDDVLDETGGKSCCIVCASEDIRDVLNSNELPKLNLVEFCHLVKINIPLRSKPLLGGFNAPLCRKCGEWICDIQKIFRQIEDLQREFNETCLKLKEQIALSSKFDKCCDINALKRTDTGICNAVAFVHHHLRKDVAVKPTNKLLETRIRKKPGRKSNLSKLLVENELRKLEENQSVTCDPLQWASRRSSFGRVVKRPRHFIEESDSEVVEKKFDVCETRDIEKLLEINDSEPEDRTTHARVPDDVNISSWNLNEDLEVRKSAGVTLQSRAEADSKCNLAGRKPKVNTSVKIKNQMKTQKKKKMLRDKKPVQTVRIIGANGEVLGTSILKDDYSSSSGRVTDKVVEEDKANLMKIKCGKCERSFSDVKKKEEHMKKVHEGGNYECQQCHQTFNRLRDLFNHKKEEHPLGKVKINQEGRKLFECEFCKTVFKNPGDLQIHRRKHTGETPYTCDSCQEGFISKGKYEIHVEANHPEIPPLSCEFCPRSFFRHHRLRDHRNTHTGERPYQCEVCGQSFSQPAYLKYHQTKHKELNLEEFKCDQCDRKFASPVNLKFHKETQHQKKYRYHCSVCGHGASHLSHLKLHMRVHTGERPFSCPHCSKTFTRGSQLKIHIRSHTGERPYACKLCTKRFTNSSKLRRHELTHVANKSKRPKEIIKVTPLTEELEESPKNELFTNASSTSAAVIIPEILEENGQHFVKLEHVQSSNSTGGDGQQLITIEQANGVTYQVIASNDVISTGEPFTEYIVLNGDFTLT